MNIREEDYAFTVEDPQGKKWDVYYFHKDGKKGTLAYYQEEPGTFTIGVLCEGNLSEEQVKQKLRESTN